jgi:epsilon-lactone hydrolase
MSLRLTLLNALLRNLAKPRLARMTDPATARRDFGMVARLFLSPGAGVARVALPGPPAILRFDPPGGATPRAILYFHGGGYLVGSPKTHQGLAARLATRAMMSVYLPDYRLAPEHAFPAAWDDADAAWDALMALGHAPGDVVLSGESAGGGLALAVLARACAAGLRPAGAALFSPFTDMTGRSQSLKSNAVRDAILPATGFANLIGHIMAGHPADDPRASPLLAAYPDCPPVLFQVSDIEILRDDSVTLAARLTAEGAKITLQKWPDTPHAWQLMVGRLPEADAAVDDAVTFVRGLFVPGATGQSGPQNLSPGKPHGN